MVGSTGVGEQYSCRERECGALGVRSQREGWNGENDFASTTFYFFVSVECKNTFPAHLLLSFHRLPVAGGVLRMIVANFAIPSTIRSPIIIQSSALAIFTRVRIEYL